MATTTGAARYNASAKYSKTLTLTMSDGTTKAFTGLQAQRVQKYLEDNPRFIYFVTDEDTGATDFYALSNNGCGFCKVASYALTTTTVDPIDCEEGMPNCPGDSLNPTTPSLTVSTQNVQVEVGKTFKVTADVVPADDTLTWTSAAEATATVAAGVITGVKAGNTTVTVKSTTGKQTAVITVMVVPAGSLVNDITGGSTANK